MFKTLATSVLVFMSLFFASFASGQSIAPTLGRNNVWTGTNQFNGGIFLPALRRCTSPQVMAGFDTSFNPICVSSTGTTVVTNVNGIQNAITLQGSGGIVINPSGQTITIACSGCAGSGVTTLNGANGAITLLGDSNVTVQLTGQNIQLHCPGCGGGGGGTPGGSPGSLQWNNSGSFGGATVIGIVKSDGTNPPTNAIPDTDFALPFVLTCGTGLSCPKVGENYNFTLTGSAGSGNVGTGLFGQLGGYSTPGTTIAGTPNMFFVNGGWSLAQLNGFFARFSGTPVTSYSITSNVVTMTGPNAFVAGDQFFLLFFPTSTFFNNALVTVLSSGLSNTQFKFNFTHADTSGSVTEKGWASINPPSPQARTSQGLAIIPPGMIDSPSSAFTNQSAIGPAAQVLDWRKGYGLQQLSAYGVKCDEQTLFVNITAGSNLVSVGSSFSSNNQPVGMTMVVGKQTGYGQFTSQQTWTPTVTSFTFPNVTLSSNAPFSYSGIVEFGTNNQAALQNAINDVAGIFPLWLPACSMLTDTVRWKGQSMIGQQMNYTNFLGFPGHDIFQQAETLPITAWSINATAGTTTFTIPWYASHSVVVGDTAVLSRFPTSTFFNNQTVGITGQPTPTTITVNSAFGQSTSSATEVGVAGSTSNVSQVGMKVYDLTTTVNNSIDPTYPWTQYDAAGNATAEPPYYRPGQQFNQPMNNPAGTGWGLGAVNGVANITQGSNVICVPTTGVNVPPLPTVNANILFPYQGTMFSAKVSSTAGSCSGGFTPYTMSASLPNTSAFTATQAEWWTYTQPQTLAAAIPSTITYPYVAYLSLPFPPAAGMESNVSSHGVVEINGDQFEYMGDQFGGTASPSYAITSVANASGGTTVYTGTFTGVTCSGTQSINISGFSNIVNNGTFSCNSATSTTITLANASGVAQTAAAIAYTAPPYIVLRTGPTSINGGSGSAVNSVAFPLNPCYGMRNQPWPVVPTINNNQATPVNAIYYAGVCAGNAGWSLPVSDGSNTVFTGSGLDLADWNNVSGNNFNTNSFQNSDNNAAVWMWQQGNNTGYGNTFRNIRVAGLWAGLMQGAASVNQHGVASVGPTSTGQSWKDCTFRTAYHFSVVNMQQSNMDRCDTYSTEVSPYDGTQVGATTGLFIGNTFSEQNGAAVTIMNQFTVKDFNDEPEGGNHEEYSPSVISDGGNITWIGNIFEGGYNIFGGNNQHIIGTQLSGPVFNYGNNNWFDHNYGMNANYNDKNVYNGAISFYNWGTFGSCQSTVGAISPLRVIGVGCIQSYDGHDVWSSMFGDGAHPTENYLGGVFTPDELIQAGLAGVYDSSELWWGKASQCSLSSTGGQCQVENFDGFSGSVYIGPHQRVTDTKYLLKMNVKWLNSGTGTFNIRFIAGDPGGAIDACTNPNFGLNLTTVTATGSGWTQVVIPVDYTGRSGCTFGFQVDNASITNVLEIGYFNFIPFNTQLFMPLGTHTVGAACPVAGQFEVDSAHMWICQPTSGTTFGAGTWQQH